MNLRFDLLADLVPGVVQSRGLLEVLALHSTSKTAGYAAPLEHLDLLAGDEYGVVELRNRHATDPLLVPMHIGFLQKGAQNHATSRALVLEPGESRVVRDCYCIQESEAGYLRRARQRFVFLPLGLRRAAFDKRGSNEDFSRLWGDIETYTRQFGVARGGHLERFLRPYFSRLMPFRHGFETEPGQVGAAYFVGGELVGLEIAPNEAHWRDVAPIFAMYAYGPAALRADAWGWTLEKPALDLGKLRDLDDLAERLYRLRFEWDQHRIAQLRALMNGNWSVAPSADTTEGLANLERGEWRGQLLRVGERLVYASLFYDGVRPLRLRAAA